MTTPYFYFKSCLTILAAFQQITVVDAAFRFYIATCTKQPHVQNIKDKLFLEVPFVKSGLSSIAFLGVTLFQLLYY
jgi:hypothetical protein